MRKPYIIIGILLPFILATLSCTPPTGMHLAEQWVDKNRGALESRFSEFLFPFEVGPGTNPVEWQFHELPSTNTEHVIIVAVASQGNTLRERDAHSNSTLYPNCQQEGCGCC